MGRALSATPAEAQLVALNERIKMSATADYEVRFLREETIADIALELRTEAGEQSSAYFNIVSFIEGFLKRKFKSKDPLTIKFFEMKDGDPPAYVTYQPLTLHVDPDVWHEAQLGDPYSRFIIAHEIGHLVLHDHHARTFSNEDGRRRRFKEISAEWQANTFATYFLLPDSMVLANMNAKGLARSCGVEESLAAERVAALEASRKVRPQIEGSFCISCGNFTERRNGSVTCVTCGKRA